MAILETRELSKSYPQDDRTETAALRNVTCTIERGEFLLITGPSGSGKTTLLSLLGAMERPTRGQVIFDGQDLGSLADSALTRVRRRVGFVFQTFSLLPSLSVWENVAYPLIPLGVARGERYRVAQSVLDQVGLVHKSRARATQLSGGELQRASVARALVGKPDVLIADEPTSNLDAESTSAVLDLLLAVHREGRTIAVVAHDPGLIPLATRLFRLECGVLLEQPNRPGKCLE
jgi:putative ABC transport system ATP-binding protein